MSWSRSPTIAASSLSDLVGAGVGQRAHLSGEGLELDPELVSLGVPGCCGPCDLGRDRLVAGLHRLDARGQLLRLADLGRDGSLLLLEGVEALRQLVDEPDDHRVRSLGLPGRCVHFSRERLELDPELVSLGVPGCGGPGDLGGDGLVAGLHRLDARRQLLEARLERSVGARVVDGDGELLELATHPDALLGPGRGCLIESCERSVAILLDVRQALRDLCELVLDRGLGRRALVPVSGNRRLELCQLARDVVDALAEVLQVILDLGSDRACRR